jgi:hypothetical protein
MQLAQTRMTERRCVSKEPGLVVKPSLTVKQETLDVLGHEGWAEKKPYK